MGKEVKTQPDVTFTELGYSSGVTSNIQAQLDDKQKVLTSGRGINIDDGTISVTPDVAGTDVVFRTWDTED